MGYSIAIILEYIILAYEYLLDACTLALGCGAFLFAISISKEIKRILRSISQQTQTKENQLRELKTFFAEYISTHGLVKQLSIISIFKKYARMALSRIKAMNSFFRVEHDFSDIFQPIIMSLFTWSLLAISGAMLIFQMEIVEYSKGASLSKMTDLCSF